MSVNSGQTYKITNVKGGTSLDLSGGDNKSITGYEWNGGPNQRWVLENNGSGWTFKNVSTGLYLAIEQNPGDGTPVVAVGNAFVWDIWPDEEDSSVHRIFVPNTRLNVDLSDHGNSNPGTPVTLWGTWPGKNQTWRFEQV